MTALKNTLSRFGKSKKLLIVPLLLVIGCASVPEIKKVPAVVLGEPSFFPTIAAHTDAPILAGNRVELLLSMRGEEISFSGSYSARVSDRTDFRFGANRVCTTTETLGSMRLAKSACSGFPSFRS